MARRRFNSKIKAEVALEAIKNDRTLEELSQKFEVHPTQVKLWKSDLVANAEKAFSKDHSKDQIDPKHVAELERKVGQLTIEIDFLKKNLSKYHKASA